MGKGKILLVDLEEAVRDMVCKAAKSVGFEVAIANHKEEALEMLTGTPFSVLMTEIGTPENGDLGWIASWRSKFPDLLILCMTAPGVSWTEVVDSGASDTLSKPFTADEITAKLKRMVRDQDAVRELTQKMTALETASEERNRLEEMKSNFILGISNEFRTPLTVIKETFSLLLDGHVGTLTEDQKEYLGIANKNILRVSNLINTLFDFSRIESGKELQLRFEPAPLVPVVEEAWMSLSQSLEEKKIIFENHLDPDTPVVMADRRRLVEVFANLIGNGIKFVPPGGKITVGARGLTEKRDYLKLVVTDTGYDTPPEDLPKIFNRFHQGQKIQEGTRTIQGLGLAITKEIIEGHRGSIQAESKPGAGTSFIFTLPVFSVNTVFSHLITPMLDKAESDKVPFSVIQVEFWDQRTKRESKLSDGVLEGVVYSVRMMVRSYDNVIPFQGNRVYIFALVDKKLAKEIGERVQTKLTQGGYIPKGTHIQFKTYSYPKEARTQEDFLKGCRLLLKED